MNETTQGTPDVTASNYLGTTYGFQMTSLAPESVRRSTKGYEITIVPLDHGFKVNVGCKSFAIESIDKLVLKLAEYLKDPNKTEQAFYEGKLEL